MNSNSIVYSGIFNLLTIDPYQPHWYAGPVWCDDAKDYVEKARMFHYTRSGLKPIVGFKLKEYK